MIENTSYFVTVFVKKDKRQAEYTQEVFIVPGDPPEVQIRFVKYTCLTKNSLCELIIYIAVFD